MPFQRPTLDELIDRVTGDIKSGLNLVNVVRRSVLGVLARAVAGMTHLLYSYLSWTSEQVFPDTAELEYLERWASIWGITRNEATFAELNIEVLGSIGAVLPQGRSYQREDGFEYTTDAELTIDATGSGIVKIIANTSGSEGDLEVGDQVSILSPVAGITSDSLVESVVVDADDTESDDSLRERLVDRLQLPPLGGSANDYIQWAREVTGVTRAWVLPLYLGLGTVGVSFVVDDEDPIIPSAAKVDEVADYIEYLKPVTALVSVFAPVAAPMDLDISIKPNTEEVQENIITELEDLVKRDATLAGSYSSPGVENDGSILLSKIRQSISIAVGLEDFEIETINGQVPANVIPNQGELITLGALTWQTQP